MNALERRRELARLTKPDLIGLLIELETATSEPMPCVCSEHEIRRQ